MAGLQIVYSAVQVANVHIETVGRRRKTGADGETVITLL